MIELWRWICCRFGKCWNCRTLSTDDGIGGKCIRCGKIHGWMTRDELRAYADQDTAALRSDWNAVGADMRKVLADIDAMTKR